MATSSSSSFSSSETVPHEHTISRPKSGDDENGEPAGLSELGRFRPVYKANTPPDLQKANDAAWKHIVEKCGGNEGEVENDFLRAIEGVEQQAVDCFNQQLNQNEGNAFQRMMVRDSCFFLQLALHILGGRELLGYPEKHPYLGTNADSTSWIAAIFFVGNQIPYVVIRALMKQTFFVNVIEEGRRRGTWRRRQDNLAKQVLYGTVVDPELAEGGLCYFKSPPRDIVHALHAMLMGSADDDPRYTEMKDFLDLEAGLDDKDAKFPSAGELYKAGIKLRKGNAGGGITKVHFRNLAWFAYLSVPPLTIDAHTRDLFTNLAKHELHSLRESDREVTAYLRFMRDLAPTYKDFKILESKGIIRVRDDELKRGTVQMLDAIVNDNKCGFTLNFRQTRHKIKGYGGPPWRIISITLALLTIVQTIFTVLSYFRPPK